VRVGVPAAKAAIVLLSVMVATAVLVVRPADRVALLVVLVVLLAVRVVLHVVPVAHAMTVVVLVAMTAVIASSPNQPSRRWW